MSEEWKKELLTKYFMATFNFSKDEAEKVIRYKEDLNIEKNINNNSSYRVNAVSSKTR